MFMWVLPLLLLFYFILFFAILESIAFDTLERIVQAQNIYLYMRPSHQCLLPLVFTLHVYIKVHTYIHRACCYKIFYTYIDRINLWLACCSCAIIAHTISPQLENRGRFVAAFYSLFFEWVCANFHDAIYALNSI